MKKNALIFKLLMVFFFLVCFSGLLKNENLFAQTKRSFHDYKVKTIDGQVFDLSKLKGKKVLVVNTASKCGLTPQYEILQKLYEQLDKSRFEIIGFPANNFKGQEPGSENEIKEFCIKNYGVTFPMMAKVSVSNYIYETYPVDSAKAEKTTTDEIYQWLTKKELNGLMDTKIEWNFQKFLIDEDGNLMGTIAPRVGKELLLFFEWMTKK